MGQELFCKNVDDMDFDAVGRVCKDMLYGKTTNSLLREYFDVGNMLVSAKNNIENGFNIGVQEDNSVTTYDAQMAVEGAIFVEIEKQLSRIYASKFGKEGAKVVRSEKFTPLIDSVNEAYEAGDYKGMLRLQEDAERLVVYLNTGSICTQGVSPEQMSKFSGMCKSFVNRVHEGIKVDGIKVPTYQEIEMYNRRKQEGEELDR